MRADDRAALALATAVLAGLAVAVAVLLAVLRLTGVQHVAWGWVVGAPALVVALPAVGLTVGVGVARFLDRVAWGRKR